MRGQQIGRTKRHLAYLGTYVVTALLGLMAAIVLQACETDFSAHGRISGPSPIPATPTPTATPTPSPSASPTPTPESCDFDILELQPRSGLTLAVKEQSSLSLTPYLQITCTVSDPRVECAGQNAGAKVRHEVSKSCNDRVQRLNSLVWAASIPSAVSIGTGYEPSIVRLTAGVVTVTATLEGQVSNPVVIR